MLPLKYNYSACGTQEPISIYFESLASIIAENSAFIQTDKAKSRLGLLKINVVICPS